MAISEVKQPKLKKMSIQQERAEARFPGLMESAPDAMVVTDQSGKIVLVNSQTEKLFLYSRKLLLNQPMEMLMPERFRATHHAHRDGYFDAPRFRPMGAGLDLFGIRQDGTEFPIEISLSPLRTPKGLYVTAAIRDITQKREEQERLARHAEKIAEQAELLDLAHDFIFVRDMKGTILFWNRGAADAYGWSKAEAEGRHASELLQTVFSEPTNEIEAKLLQEGHWEGELVHTTRQGAKIVVASRWVVKRDRAVEPQAILEINNDITMRKQAEERIHLLNANLTRRSAELEASNTELEAFSYSVAHDLRAPLRHIDGFSKLLVDEVGSQLPADAQRYVAIIQESTRLMGRLVDDLLNLGRVSRKELRTQTTSLKQIVDEVVTELTVGNPQRSIIWNVHCLPFVECDPGLIKQVFANLLSNAIKFTAPREYAIIEIRSIGGSGPPTIVVRDNGVGFSMKYA
ncbi:MAG: sensor histidine kinase, partial [Terriglobales bacterium]